MRENKVKRVLREGGVSLGTMVFDFNSTGIGRIAAAAGAEFVIFDMEHTGWSVETIRGLIATSRSADLAPFVRVPATQYHFIARPLDVGAMGLMIPMVESHQQAQAIVQYAKYPPMGRRGAAFGVAHDDYENGDVLTKIQSANDEGLLIAQIETAQGVEKVDEIAAVDGIDIVWIGHFDLTNSLGIPAQFDHPDYLAAVDRVAEAARENGKVAGFMTSDPDNASWLLGKGFRCLAYSGDIWIYKQALAEGIAAVRAEAAKGV